MTFFEYIVLDTLPWGPDVQYATEKKWNNMEVRVYPGADGEFTLYEDENDNYNYEKGIYSTIKMKWNDAQKSLTIEDRTGKFPGMLSFRQFKVVLVTSDKGIGDGASASFDKTISYSGKKKVVKFW